MKKRDNKNKLKKEIKENKKKYVIIHVDNSLKPKKYTKCPISRIVGEVAEQIRIEHGMNDGAIKIDDMILDLNLTFEEQDIPDGAELRFENGIPREQQQLNQNDNQQQLFASTFPDGMSLLKPNFSASAIAGSHRHLYDIFSLPTSSETYIPNERVRNLLNQYNTFSNEEVLHMIESKLHCLKSVHSWKLPTRGSETKITNPSLLSYLITINDLNNTTRNSSITNELNINTFLASNPKPEPFIQYNSHVLIASEAKGLESSDYLALVQGFQVGGDGAINLRRYLSIKDSVVPVILSFGTYFKIFAVYLLPENFPVMVELSEPISYITRTGRLSLARWAAVLNSFFVETINLLFSPSLKQNNNLNQNKVYLSRELFYKPILNNFNTGDLTLNTGSCLRSCVELVMLAYKRLSEVEDSDNFFLFPVGLMSYPADQFEDSFFFNVRLGLNSFFNTYFRHKKELIRNGCPIIVFNLLDSSWKNNKPPEEFRRLYIDGIDRVVSILNSAEIAHLDLRPTNIMWKILDDNTLKIRVIDFEDSLPFNTIFYPYPNLLIDRRYPFFQQDHAHKITKSHNNWFLVAIRQWIESDIERFEDFMVDENYFRVKDEWESTESSLIDEGKIHG